MGPRDGVCGRGQVRGVQQGVIWRGRSRWVRTGSPPCVLDTPVGTGPAQTPPSHPPAPSPQCIQDGTLSVRRGLACPHAPSQCGCPPPTELSASTAVSQGQRAGVGPLLPTACCLQLPWGSALSPHQAWGAWGAWGDSGFWLQPLLWDAGPAPASLQRGPDARGLCEFPAPKSGGAWGAGVGCRGLQGSEQASAWTAGRCRVHTREARGAPWPEVNRGGRGCGEAAPLSA